MGLNRAQRKVLRHVSKFFEGHEIDVRRSQSGPVDQRIPGFAVACVGPGDRHPGLWSYVSLGCWGNAGGGEHGLEFVIASAVDDDRLVELSAMNAYYHCGPASQRLDVGHTVPIGEPWLDGSACDHLLVSVPYPYGPDFEVCSWRGGHARILWLLPISEREREFKSSDGLASLEERFEAAGLLYWDANRPSIV